MIKPGSEKFAALMERDGRMSPAASLLARRLMALARMDLAVLYLVLADMALKPSGEDVLTLVLMAVVLIAVVTYTLVRVRSLAPADGAPATAES